ncbi:ORF4 protein [Armillaria mellea negative strand RNA virus 2]|uniref:ORF4 protein n=1 Tax=Armillaria mellea negative strand RNA virus 2 TaxID=2803971 RepID=A0A8D9PCS0_9MONO|nr:ORF4 protein [Armillaria mellea negative strand RNA virus 2]DAD54830.1 TPA_asm: ORF4 protein [Armillaria mellea negative strand RNA virus 2]
MSARSSSSTVSFGLGATSVVTANIAPDDANALPVRACFGETRTRPSQATASVLRYVRSSDQATTLPVTSPATTATSRAHAVALTGLQFSGVASSHATVVELRRQLGRANAQATTLKHTVSQARIAVGFLVAEVERARIIGAAVVEGSASARFAAETRYPFLRSNSARGLVETLEAITLELRRQNTITAAAVRTLGSTDAADLVSEISSINGDEVELQDVDLF